MTPNERLFNVVCWAIFLFIALSISNTCEYKLAQSLGCRLSPAFAQSLADMKKSGDEQRLKDPEGTSRISHQMLVTRYTVRGVTSGILAILIVYFRKVSRGVPYKSPEPSPTAP
jgi:hypothetical protein